MKSQNRFVFIVTLIISLSMLLSSCGTATTPTPAPVVPAATTAPVVPAATTAPVVPAATTAPTSSGPVSIQVWTKFESGSDATRYAAMEATIKEFNKENPDIIVTQITFDYSEFEKSVNLAVTSGQAGCIVEADTYANNLWPWYYGGYLVSLEQYAQQYGWLTKDTGGAVLSSMQGLPASKVHDGPEIVGIPFFYSILGLYYNKQMFDANGIQPPTTWPLLIAAMEGFKAKGIVPLALGNSGQDMGLQLLSSLIMSNGTYDQINKIFSGDPSVKFSDPDFLWAFQTGADWAAKGYLPKDFNSISLDDQLGEFTAGKIPMIMAGAWAVGASLAAKPPVDIHWLPFPAYNTSAPWAIVKTPDWPLVMMKTCPYKDQAAKFLDFMTGEFVADTWYQAGYIPSWPFDASKLKVAYLASEIDQGIQGKQSGYYINVVDPEVNNIIWPLSQNVLDGSMSPTAFAQAIQTAHEKYLTERPK